MMAASPLRGARLLHRGSVGPAFSSMSGQRQSRAVRRAPFQLVDVFASPVDSIGYSGNPAGVVQLSSIAQCSADAMQTIATEVNAPATAFVAPAAASGGAFDIRWFSSSVELPLCGHATFGAAKALLQQQCRKATDSGERTLTFHSHLAGQLSVRACSSNGSLELSLE